MMSNRWRIPIPPTAMYRRCWRQWKRSAIIGASEVWFYHPCWLAFSPRVSRLRLITYIPSPLYQHARNEEYDWLDAWNTNLEWLSILYRRNATASNGFSVLYNSLAILQDREWRYPFWIRPRQAQGTTWYTRAYRRSIADLIKGFWLFKCRHLQCGQQIGIL